MCKNPSESNWTAQVFTDANIWHKSVTNEMARFITDFDVLTPPTSPVPRFAPGFRALT